MVKIAPRNTTKKRLSGSHLRRDAAIGSKSSLCEAALLSKQDIQGHKHQDNARFSSTTTFPWTNPYNERRQLEEKALAKRCLCNKNNIIAVRRIIPLKMRDSNTSHCCALSDWMPKPSKAQRLV